MLFKRFASSVLDDKESSRSIRARLALTSGSAGALDIRTWRTANSFNIRGWTSRLTEWCGCLSVSIAGKFMKDTVSATDVR